MLLIPNNPEIQSQVDRTRATPRFLSGWRPELLDGLMRNRPFTGAFSDFADRPEMRGENVDLPTRSIYEATQPSAVPKL